MIEQVTYAELVQLISQEKLTSGQRYLLIDFRTRLQIPNTSDFWEESVEALLLTATANNKLHEVAQSQEFPEDIIYYTVSNYFLGSDRGSIIYRKDPQSGNEAHEDFRGIKYRRWDDGFGEYTSLVNNGNSAQDEYVFGGRSSFSSTGNKIGFNSTNLSNTIIGSFSSGNIFGEFSQDNTILSNSSNNVLGNEADEITLYQGSNNNVFGHGCKRVTFNGSGTGYSSTGCSNNTIGNNSTDIEFGIGSSNNVIGNSVINVTFGLDCLGNEIDDRSTQITLGDYCDNTYIGVASSNSSLPNQSDSNSFKQLVNVTISSPFENVRVEYPISGATIINTTDNIHVNMQSPNGNLWYLAVDNAGSTTVTQFT